MTSKYIGTITNFTIYEQQPGLMEQIIVGYSVFFLAVMIVAPILTYFCVGERAYSDLQPNQRYAPAWKRVVAYIIDIGILWVLQKAIVFLIGLLLLFFWYIWNRSFRAFGYRELVFVLALFCFIPYFKSTSNARDESNEN